MKIIDDLLYYLAIGLPSLVLIMMLSFLYIGIVPINLIPLLVLVAIGEILVIIGVTVRSCNNEEIIITGDMISCAAVGLYVICLLSMGAHP